MNLNTQIDYRDMYCVCACVCVRARVCVCVCAHLGGEDCLPGLGDHVELLDGGSQVAGGAQVGEAHETALRPHVVMGPVVPLVRGVRGYGGAERTNSSVQGNQLKHSLPKHCIVVHQHVMKTFKKADLQKWEMPHLCKSW